MQQERIPPQTAKRGKLLSTKALSGNDVLRRFIAIAREFDKCLLPCRVCRREASGVVRCGVALWLAAHALSANVSSEWLKMQKTGEDGRSRPVTRRMNVAVRTSPSLTPPASSEMITPFRQICPGTESHSLSKWLRSKASLAGGPVAPLVGRYGALATSSHTFRSLADDDVVRLL